jgi:hypothetical protein
LSSDVADIFALKITGTEKGQDRFGKAILP